MITLILLIILFCICPALFIIPALILLSINGSSAIMAGIGDNGWIYFEQFIGIVLMLVLVLAAIGWTIKIIQFSRKIIQLIQMIKDN